MKHEYLNQFKYMIMGLQVITASSEHAPAISYIGRTAFRDAFSGLFNKKAELEEYLHYTYNIDKITSSINKENNVYFIASIDGCFAGFAKVKKHSLNDQLTSVFQAELQKLYVLKKYQGKGVGQFLMDAAKNLVSSFEPDCLWLDTHVTNTRAIKFYERNGFTRAGKHHFTIGTQTFEYFLMTAPVAVAQTC